MTSNGVGHISAAAMGTQWTIAYRRPTANRFIRVINWAGTWAQAREVADQFSWANPDLQVFYVPSVHTEEDWSAPQDRGNILVESGRRVRMVDIGRLSPEIRANIPTAEAAQARWNAIAQ